MRKLLLATTLLVGCASNADDGERPAPPPSLADEAIDLDNDKYPDVRSFCDPDRPKVRIYVTEITNGDHLRYGAGGGGVAVLYGDHLGC